MAIYFINLIDMHRKNKQQNNLTRAHFHEESESQAQNAQQIQNILNTDANHTSVATLSTSTDIYGDAFNFVLSKIFTKRLLASLPPKDAILKVARDCVLFNNEERCKRISHYIHYFCYVLHVKAGCRCIDDRIAKPHAIKDANLDVIHSTHAKSWGITSMVIQAWWQYMNREFLTKTSNCTKYTKIS